MPSRRDKRRRHSAALTEHPIIPSGPPARHRRAKSVTTASLDRTASALPACSVSGQAPGRSEPAQRHDSRRRLPAAKAATINLLPALSVWVNTQRTLATGTGRARSVIRPLSWAFTNPWWESVGRALATSMAQNTKQWQFFAQHTPQRPSQGHQEIGPDHGLPLPERATHSSHSPPQPCLVAHPARGACNSRYPMAMVDLRSPPEDCVVHAPS